uniref:1-acyl-sn-glycerol-3-phosphate acyltransferase n=1 Tax=Kalanchoe fedtschenkoi TaxID=63787 RepID=A0A7N0V7E9_KALFE
MEVCVPPHSSFIQSSSPHRQRESRSCLWSSSPLLCTYGEFQSKYSTNGVTITMSNTLTFDRGWSSRIRFDARCYLSPKEDIQKTHFSYKFQRTNKSSRCILVRSELAEAGTPDSYPISDLKLGSKIRGIFFYGVTSLSAIFLFIIMLGAHPFVLLLDRYRRRAHHLVAKIWATCTVTPFYKVQFEGLENLPKPETPAVYVSNHQSFLDIYTLLTLGRSFKFISKTAIFLIPIIGWAMFLMGTIPLKRMDSRSQLDCLKRCMALVKNGASVFFFPEGTRSRNGKLGAFKKGAFSIAAKTGVPVVPITLEGTGNIMPAGMETILNSGSVRVIIHKPIEGNDAEALCTEARKIISAALDKDE